MIISRTPFRISFAGGGSDLRDYYSEYGGKVLSVSINKYIYLSLHPYFMENKYFLKYSKNELADSVDQIEHRIVRQVFQEYGITGVDFNSSADVPSGTGLGSSSCFTVGLVNLCSAYTGKHLPKEAMADAACRIEIDELGEPIGKQDQYGCAVGGLKFIEFNPDESVVVEKIMLRKEKKKQLQESLMLFFLVGTLTAGSILAEQKKNTSGNKKTISGLHRLVELADILKKEMFNNNIESVGDILHSGWMYKKELSGGISNERIDHYYNLAIQNGATGGKLLGAGGNGFLLFYVPVEDQQKLKLALSDLRDFPFEFEESGTSIIYSS